MLIAVGCHDVINRWEGRFGGHALLEVVSGYDDASSKPNPDR
jgi:beta-phosphoglucomutase-like phosphatase (HAD superfamily)